MDTGKIAVLLKIVEAGSFHRAARDAGMTRAFLRRALDALEAEVGVPLLHRDAAGVRLTSAGALVVARGRVLVRDAESLVADARTAAEEAAGVLRFVEPLGLPLSMRTTALMAARAAFPRLAFVIRDLEHPELQTDDAFDLMVHDAPVPRGRNWFSRVILRAPLRLMASESYLAEHGVPTDVGELCQHRVLGFRHAEAPLDELPLLAGGSVKVAPWLVSGDRLLLRALCVAGGGLLLAPNVPLAAEPGSPPLVPVLPDLIGSELLLRLSTPVPNRADARARAVVAQVLEIVDSLNDG